MASVYRRKGTHGKYRAKFRGVRGEWRDVLAYSDVKASEEMARKLERLASLRAAGEAPSQELSRFVRGLPVRLQTNLAKWGILDGAAHAGTKPLTKHLADYKAALLAGVASNRQKGPATSKHARTVCKRVTALLEGIGATYLSDVRSEDVGTYLAELRALGIRSDTDNEDTGTPKPLSVQTTNHWLQNAQSFFAWLVRTKRATTNPLHGVPKIQVTEGKRKLKRRPLEHDEAGELLKAARSGPIRCHMPAEERYWLYRMALETALRSSELRALVRGNFELDDEEPLVWLTGDSTKNNKPAELPLRAETVGPLTVYLAGKHPDAKAFPNMPPVYDVADMLREDLIAAGIDFENDSGRADFHSLRGTCLSWLANAGTPLKTLQDFARHSTPVLTMNHYARTLRGSLAGAAARLPDLSGSGLAVAKATGTDGKAAQKTTPRTTPNGSQKRAIACNTLHGKSGKVSRSGICKKDYNSREMRRTELQGTDSHQSDSNRRPAVYKTAALPTELRWRVDSKLL
jgi:integrase